jgi:tRNA threonylcarbamoyladenosine biosynthesis protein TsaB
MKINTREKPLLLLVETSTDVCSVGLAADNRLIAQKVSHKPKAHASIISPITEELLEENRFTPSDIDAVVISAGPGSYTGLRVGLSFAKGIAFASEIPLISVGSLNLIASLAGKEANKEKTEILYIVPMIDARRMEVYTTIFDADLRQLSNVEAKIINQNSFDGILDKGKVLFCGNGAPKVSQVIDHPNALFKNIDTLASGMVDEAFTKYHNKDFEDLAYFEPFYLKEFVAGISKKDSLGRPRV